MNEYPIWWEKIFNGEHSWDAAFWSEGAKDIYNYGPSLFWYYIRSLGYLAIPVFVLFKLGIVRWDNNQWLRVYEMHFKKPFLFLKKIWFTFIFDLILIFSTFFIFLIAVGDMQKTMAKWKERESKLSDIFNPNQFGVKVPVKEEGGDIWRAPMLSLLFVDPVLIEDASVDFDLIKKEDIRRWLKITGFSIGPLGVSFDDISDKKKDAIQSWYSKIIENNRNTSIIKFQQNLEANAIKNQLALKLLQFKEIESSFSVSINGISKKIIFDRIYDAELKRQISYIGKYGKYLLVEGAFQRKNNSLEMSARFRDDKIALKLKVPIDFATFSKEPLLTEAKSLKLLLLLVDRGSSEVTPVTIMGRPILIWL